MAEIVDKIFGLSPEEVQIANQQRTQDLNKMFLSAPTTSQRLGGVLGVALGSGLSKVFPSEDPQLNKAVGMSKIQKGLRDDYTAEQLQDPNIFFPELSKRLAEAGFQNEASEATILGQKQIDDYNKNQSIIQKNTREKNTVTMTALQKAKEALRIAQVALDKDPLNPLLLQDVEDYQLAVNNLLKKGEEAELSLKELEAKAYATLSSNTASKEDKKAAQDLINRIQATEEGMRYNSSEEKFEWIPGSPGYKKALATKKNEITSAVSKLPKQDRMRQKIDYIKTLVNPLSVGMGSLLKRIPNTKANDLVKAIDEVIANIGFDRLQRMRDESPTGGALGQVAVQELKMLQSVLGSLDTSQTVGQFISQLDKVYEEFDAAFNNIDAKVKQIDKEYKEEFPEAYLDLTQSTASPKRKKPEVPLAERDDLFN